MADSDVALESPLSIVGFSGYFCVVSADLPEPPSKANLPLWGIVCLCLMSAAGFYIYKIREVATAEGAMRILVVDVDVEDVPADVLPHAVDHATEFKDSLKHLKYEAVAPDYRETPASLKVVDAKVAPAQRETIKVDGILVTSKKPPEPVGVVGDTNVVELSEGASVGMRVDRDWEGVVLVPDSVKMARAYSTSVRMGRIEAHPIEGGRIRVWSRIENLTAQPMQIETACEFRFLHQRATLTPFRSLWIPAGGAIDVDYISPTNRVNAHTLMVK